MWRDTRPIALSAPDFPDIWTEIARLHDASSEMPYQIDPRTLRLNLRALWFPRNPGGVDADVLGAILILVSPEHLPPDIARVLDDEIIMKFEIDFATGAVDCWTGWHNLKFVLDLDRSTFSWMLDPR